jgi:hypothetical protein
LDNRLKPIKLLKTSIFQLKYYANKKSIECKLLFSFSEKFYRFKKIKKLFKLFKYYMKCNEKLLTSLPKYENNINFLKNVLNFVNSFCLQYLCLKQSIDIFMTFTVLIYILLKTYKTLKINI